MAIIYDDPDHVGHSAGHDTPEYYARMEELDALLGEIITAIKEAGIYDDSVIIVTSDHGGINHGHGGQSMMEMETPFIIAGKNIKQGGEFSEVMLQQDTAHTLAEIFGLTVPQMWSGNSMSHVFEQ
jgi:arylsulfatase A-like enzyme